MSTISFLFSFLMYTIGYFASAIFLKSNLRYERALLSLPLGFGLFCIITTSLFFVGASVSGEILAISCVLLFLLSIFSAQKFGASLNLKYFLFSLPVVIFFIASLEILDLNLFCGDTMLSANAMRGLSQNNLTGFSSWGADFLVYLKVADAAGLIYFKSFLTLLCLNFILVFQYHLYLHTADRIGKVSSIIFSLLATLFITTSLAFVKIAFLIHSNVMLMTYLFIFAIYLMRAIEELDRKILLLTILLAIIGSLARLEAPLFFWVFLTIFLLNEKRIPFKNRINAYIGFNAVFFLFYGVLFFKSNGTDIVSVGRAISLSLGFLLSPLFFYITEKYTPFKDRHFYFICIVACTAVLFSSHLLLSLRGMINNCRSQAWQMLFYGSVIFSTLFLLNKEKINRSEKKIFLCLFFCFYLLLFFSLFRSPFYESIYDSSSRIMISFFALLLFFLLRKIGGESQPNNGQNSQHLSNKEW